MKQQTTVELAGGKQITFETGRIAKQASGAAFVTSGDTVVLATAVGAPDPKEGVDFFPLTVEYRETAYGGGRIPGGFIKREGRPSEKEILTSRQIDRPIRPLFPETYRNETQVVAFVYSADKQNDPDIIAINAASCALALSDIPFEGPIGAVRVGLIDGNFVINPTYDEREKTVINITVAGTKDGIVMVESGAREATEEQVVSAIEFGHEQIKKICEAIIEFAKIAGKPKRQLASADDHSHYYDELRKSIGEQLTDVLNTQKYGKTESYSSIKQLKDEAKKSLPEGDPAASKRFGKVFELLRENIFREQVLNDRVRPDRRAFDEIRQIDIEVGILPRTHGSALFTRGETQALVTATLGTADDAQRMESYVGEQKRRFMLHYNFPPYSVGEVGRMTGTGRREIGHGALAQRAIEAVLPDEKDSPYTLRIVSDITESNGSSSMAAVCGASLALMQAGIPLKGSVAGVAMGLVKEGEKYAILTDIAGAEDHYGDMDFKVAGTRNGITALQMDIKIMGITPQIMREALEQARHGRLFLLDKMDAVINGASQEKSRYAPQIRTLQIPTDKIRDLIGPGGKVIRGIIEATQVKIDVDDSGKVDVSSSDPEGLAKALQMISDITAVPEVGKTYLGKVVRLAEFGAFVEIFPGTDGLLHVSEIAEHRVKDVKDELREGDQVLVKVLAIEGNRVKLSRKAVLREQRVKLGLPEVDPNAASGGDDRGGRSERSDRGDRGGRDRSERSDRSERPERSSERVERAPRPERVVPAAPAPSAETITLEGGDDFDEDDDLDDFDGDDEGEDETTPATTDGVAVETTPGQRPAAGAGRRRRRRGGRRSGPGTGNTSTGNGGGAPRA